MYVMLTPFDQCALQYPHSLHEDFIYRTLWVTQCHALITHTSPLHVIILSLLSNLSLPKLICKCACTVIKETSVPLQKRGFHHPTPVPTHPPPHSGNSLRMRRSCHVRMSQADVYRSPTLQMHPRHWCSSQVIIIKDIQHLRTSLIMVYMDFEALMKNSLLLWVYCVCTNCGDGVRQECPPS